MGAVATLLGVFTSALSKSQGTLDLTTAGLAGYYGLSGAAKYSCGTAGTLTLTLGTSGTQRFVSSAASGCPDAAFRFLRAARPRQTICHPRPLILGLCRYVAPASLP